MPVGELDETALRQELAEIETATRRLQVRAGISVDEVALGCYDHHPVIDRQHWTGRMIDGQVVWSRPGDDHPPPPGDPPGG